MDTSSLAAFVLTAMVIELTPGPNMAYIAIVSAMHGWRAGAFVTAGVALGLSVIGVALAVGFGEVVLTHPMVYETLRWIGFAYLLWLAWDAWRGSNATAVPTLTADDHQAFFRRGLITNLLNPKAALFFISVLPGFIPAGTAMPQTALWLTAIYVGIATMVHAGLSLAGDQIKRGLNRPRQMFLLQRAFALLLAAVALWFLMTTK
jgi:threonine/homoserine/homoserine lactone efflux protein